MMVSSHVLIKTSVLSVLPSSTWITVDENPTSLLADSAGTVTLAMVSPSTSSGGMVTRIDVAKIKCY